MRVGSIGLSIKPVMKNNPDNSNLNDDQDIDQRAADLLRSVGVPADLAKLLLKIPDADPASEPDATVGVESVGDSIDRPPAKTQKHAYRSETRWRQWTLATVAAVYLVLGISVVVFWPANSPGERLALETWSNRNEKPSGVSKAKETARANKRDSRNNERNPEPVPRETGAGQRGAEDWSSGDFDRNLDQIDVVLNELKLKRLEGRLKKLERINRVELDEKYSLVLAVSDQTGFYLGGDKELIARDMRQIRDRFQGTRGAEIASQFLNSNFFQDKNSHE